MPWMYRVSMSYYLGQEGTEAGNSVLIMQEKENLSPNDNLLFSSWAPFYKLVPKPFLKLIIEDSPPLPLHETGCAQVSFLSTHLSPEKKRGLEWAEFLEFPYQENLNEELSLPWNSKTLYDLQMVGWHHQLKRRESEQALGDGEGQGSLECCSLWGCKESDTTERLNNDLQKDVQLPRGKGSRGRNWEIGMDTYTVLILCIT